MTFSGRQLVFSWFGFWVAFALIGLYLVLPLRERIRFGIDLVGGTYITLEVQVEKAVEAELVEAMQSLASKLQTERHITPTMKAVESKVIKFSFANLADAQAAAQLAAADFSKYTQSSQGTELQLQLSESQVKKVEQDAVLRNIDVLRTRLDSFSVAEINIAAHGERNIVIELPDVSDPQQAKAMIGRAAQLEFRLVEKVGNSEADILYECDGQIPYDMEILSDRAGEGRHKMFYLVHRYTDITGKLLRDAQPRFDSSHSQMVVSFEFTPEGGDKFYAMTSKNYGKALGVVLDGVVITAPRINEPIRSSGQIQGNFNAASAKELAHLLKSGAFVAPVTFEEERQIGPTLGKESIDQGLLACMVSLLALFIFSVFCYKVAGVLAVIALIYNLLLTLIGLATLNATLTLPGIAGMVLTIGMAIDASILIYERIKEELAAGVTVKTAVNNGFKNAMAVILDANITTFIVGVVLYKFGTGPIQGFAVTMMLGIISTLITGLFFLKTLFTAYLDTFNVKNLKI